MYKYSKLNLNTFALSCTLVHTQLTVTVMQQLNAKVFKLSFEYLHIYSQKEAIFAGKNSKVASLMSCQRSDLRKTLKYSQSRDLEGIQ